MGNVLIKDLGRVITGNTPSKNNNEFYSSDDIGFIKPDVISDEKITYIKSANEFISERARTKVRIVNSNAVLVTCIGSIGKICIVKEGEYAFNQQINAIEPNERVSAEYLAYCLLYNKKRLVQMANAPVVPIINKTQFENFQININEKRETQNRIVEILNGLSNAIDMEKKQIDQLDTLIKARFVEMFGNERRHMVMNDLCTIITDGTHQPPKFVQEGIPFIFVSNIAGDEITYTVEKFISPETYNELIKRTPIEIGDVLLSTVGSYGHPAVVKSDRKFLFQRHIAYLKPKRDMVDSDYLHGALLAPDAQRQIEIGVKGLAQKTLNLSEIKKITIPVPEIRKQKEFAAFVHQVDKFKVMQQKRLEQTRILFDSLMQQYFG